VKSFIIDYAEAAEDLSEEKKRQQMRDGGGNFKTFKGHGKR
jgi:hypothetical protein